MYLGGKALGHFVHSNQKFMGEANQKLVHDVGTESIQMRRTCTVQYSVLDDRLAFCGLYIVEYYVGIAGNCTP